MDILDVYWERFNTFKGNKLGVSVVIRVFSVFWLWVVSKLRFRGDMWESKSKIQWSGFKFPNVTPNDVRGV